MSRRVLGEVTDENENDKIVHTPSSSRPRSIHIASSMAPHTLESGPKRGETPSSAKPSLHRTNSATVRSSHATKPTVPGAWETQSSHSPSSSPSPSPPLLLPLPSPSPSPSLTSSQSISTYHPAPSTSYSNSQLSASPVNSRSTPARRQPASRSSHGIETASGPPPALITQRSYTTEVPRRQPAPADLIATRPHLRHRSQTDSNIDTKAQRQHVFVDERTYDSPLPSSSVKTRRESDKGKARMDLTSSIEKNRQSPGDDLNQISRGLARKDPSKTLSVLGEPNAQEGTKPQRSQEDLFLNLANSGTLADEPKEGMSRSERRHSRVGASTLRQPYTPQQTSSRPSSSRKQLQGLSIPSSHDSANLQWSPSRLSEDQDLPYPTNKAVHRDRQYTPSSQPLDMRNDDSHFTPSVSGTSHKSRARRGSNLEKLPDMPAVYERRQSVRESSPGLPSRTYKQSNLSYSTNGQNSILSIARIPESHVNGKRPQGHQAEGTESTVSTTAPSTIWDDLQDLKERMRKLELRSTEPESSGAVIPNVLGDGPRTVSTTMTTLSTSPKHFRAVGATPEASTSREVEATQIHPLLRNALATSKELVEPDVYNALEATVSNALTLAAMTGSVVGLESSHSTASTPKMNRQLRKKADNMCRNLTELCNAISTTVINRTNVRAATPLPSTEGSISLYQSIEGDQEPNYLRAASEDIENRMRSRVQNQLEVRRMSLQLRNNPTLESYLQDTTPFQVTDPNAEWESPASVVMPRRGTEIEPIHDYHRNNRIRATPSSRSATEIGTQFQPSPASWNSRQSTLRHPLSSPSQAPPPPRPPMESTLPLRRGYLMAATGQHHTLTQPMLPSQRRRLALAAPRTAEQNARLAEMRDRRLASLGMLGPPSLEIEDEATALAREEESILLGLRGID